MKMADITYCSCECGNANCERNQENINEPDWVSIAMLKDTEYCDGWEEKENG
jgi:hypothetical protein